MWKGKNQFLPTCLNVGCQKKFTQAKNSLAKLKISLQPEQTICLEHIIPMGTCAHLARCAYVRSGADEKTWFTIGVPNPNVFNRMKLGLYAGNQSSLLQTSNDIFMDLTFSKQGSKTEKKKDLPQTVALGWEAHTFS